MMKVTRYIQSGLVLEEGGTRIGLDFGSNFKETHDVSELGKLDAVLYTHEHQDHFDPAIAKKFLDAGVPVYANASTAKQVDGKVNVVEDDQEFSVGDFKFKARELPHCLMPNGSEGPQNTGYVINDKLFDPGDGKELEGLQVENIALPITGPDISMKDAYDFAKQVGAKKAIAIHYDIFGANPDLYVNFAQMSQMPFSIVALKEGESTEI